MNARRLAIALAIGALHGAAGAQIVQERLLPRPIEPGEVQPYRADAPVRGDVGETTMLTTAPTGPTLQDWYAKQGRPAVVLYVDRRLERLPPGWDGTARIMIAQEKQAGGKTETLNTSIALEHKEAAGSVQARRPVIRLIENSLLREMQRLRFKMIDPVVAERALASKGRSGADSEFESLRASAGYILEVEFAPTDGAVSIIGGLKDVKTGEIVTTVRSPVERDLNDPSASDELARIFLKRLLASQPSV